MLFLSSTLRMNHCEKASNNPRETRARVKVPGFAQLLEDSENGLTAPSLNHTESLGLSLVLLEGNEQESMSTPTVDAAECMKPLASRRCQVTKT